jgi:hypothetical protein
MVRDKDMPQQYQRAGKKSWVFRRVEHAFCHGVGVALVMVGEMVFDCDLHRMDAGIAVLHLLPDMPAMVDERRFVSADPRCPWRHNFQGFSAYTYVTSHLGERLLGFGVFGHGPC